MLILVAGCTAPSSDSSAPDDPAQTKAPSSTGGDKFLIPAQVEAEYVATVAAFPETLPDGVEFPAEYPGKIDENSTVQPGVGASAANFFWQCAWMDEYLTAYAANDVAVQDSALVELEKWTTFPFYKTNVIEDPSAGWQTMVIDPAKLGDASVMKEFYSNGQCSIYDGSAG